MKKKIAFIVLGLVVAVTGGQGFAAEATSAPSSQPAAGDVVVELPMAYEVVQRGADGGGTVVIKGHLSNTAAGKKVEVRVVGEKGNVVADWREVSLGADKAFGGTVAVPAGGWYRVEVRSPSLDKDEETAVDHVGVGEVFVTGGQSNSTNYGAVKTKTETGMVSEFDGEKWVEAKDPLPGVDGTGGSPWCLFGDDMYERLHVPIGIAPVGKGSTSVRQWLPKGDVVEIEPTKTYGMKKNGEGKWESEGMLFDHMVERMKQLDALNGAAPGSPGFRAMLWHQGESDAFQKDGHTLPGKDYRAYLERVVNESRKEVGWRVPWFVAFATYNGLDQQMSVDIRSAQQGLEYDGVAFHGPDTDRLAQMYRDKGGAGVHMSLRGLFAHASGWADIVEPWLRTQLKVAGK